MTYIRKEVIGDSTLYLGNAMEIMPTLESVDLICTDAPYLVATGGKSEGRGGWQADYANDGKIVTCDLDWSDWLPLAYQVLKNDRQAYFMSDGKNMFAAHAAAIAAGFKLHEPYVWDKRSASPNRWGMKVCEFTLFMRKGKAFTIADPSTKTLFSMFQRDETAHRTEKPVELMSQYVCNSTRPGQMVLDPFMGVGTTGVAAIRYGRRFTGIEIEARWFDAACERITKAHEDAYMFKRPLLMAEPAQTSMFDGDAA